MVFPPLIACLHLRKVETLGDWGFLVRNLKIDKFVWYMYQRYNIDGTLDIEW